MGKRTATDLPADFPDIAYHQVDIAGPIEPAAALASQASRIILAAGVGFYRPLERETDTSIADAMAVNFTSVTRLLHALHLQLVRNSARVALLGSIAAGGSPGMPVYSASKGALAGLARSLASEWEDQVVVRHFRLWPIRTPMHERAGYDARKIDWLLMDPDSVARRILDRLETVGPANQAVSPLSLAMARLGRRGTMTRRALVTGGSAGLGKAFVDELLARGIAVVSIDRDLPHETSPRLHAIQADLGDLAALPALVSALDAAEPFDIVVFNAGISAVGAFETIGIDQMEKLIAVNLLAPMELSRLLLSDGRVTERASLIFIGSLSNRLGYPGASVYAATKQGIEAFATSLRKAGSHVVLCVLPGPLDTEHASRYAPKGGKAGNRQGPAILARRVLVRQHRSGTVYGTLAHRLAGLAGTLVPAWLTALMRRGIFEKLRDAPPVTDACRPIE